MNTFPLLISTPDGNRFSGDAVMLTLRGIEGELAVMAGHTPFVTSVVKCNCKLTLDGHQLTVNGNITVGIYQYFILNLADTSAKRYLKVNVALELSKTEEEIKKS